MTEIRYFNRLTSRFETEVVYGERWLRWVYGTLAGRVALHLLVKRAIFSAWYGRRMDSSRSRAKIQPFLDQYGVDPAEFEDPVSSFRSFNEFFSRRLKPEARPVDEDAGSLVFPADGRHLLIPNLERQTSFWIKGERFEVGKLLDEVDLAAHFKGGAALISRLCPVDYHRFHFPCGGVPGLKHWIGGPLYSVNPLALARRPSILWENKRCWSRLETEKFGTVVLVEIGATCVGSIHHTAAADVPVLKGQEHGFFRFGGSSVVTLLEPGVLEWAPDLLEHSASGCEVYARMGQPAGRRI